MKRVRFGKYDLMEKIASGGMAEIWLAKQLGVGGFSKLVVIKRIHKHLSHDEEFVAMFINEARVAAQLTHQNIVQIYDFGEVQGAYYIGMEYIHGKDLKTIYNRCRMLNVKIPLELSLHIIQQICNGLDYAHRKRDYNNRNLDIVHRDVSPQNILISQEGEIKITDFGIAKAATQLRATQAGTLKGKIAYMSPEQAWGKEIDRRSDIFAIGIIFYEILMNKRLFLGASDLETLENVRQCHRISLRDEDAAIPAEIERIVRKALEKDVQQRYQNAREMYQELEMFSIQSGFLHQPYHLAEFLRNISQDKPVEDPELKSLRQSSSPLRPPAPIEQASESAQSPARDARPGKPVTRIRRSQPEPLADIVRKDAPVTSRGTGESPLDQDPSPASDGIEQSTGLPQTAQQRVQSRPEKAVSASLRAILRNDQFILRLIFVGGIILAIAAVFVARFLLGPGDGDPDPTATLAITSNVAGARIYFDDKPLGELSQMSGLLQRLPAGKHTLFLKANGYKDYSVALEFKHGEQKTLDVELKPYTGMLSIASNLDDVNVVVRSADSSLRDSQTYSTVIYRGSPRETPRYHLIDEIPVGTYQVTATRDNVPGFSRNVTILKDQATQLYAALVEREVTWTLALTANVSGADIILNSEKMGETRDIAPVQLSLQPGHYNLLVKKEGYHDFFRELDLQSDLPFYITMKSLDDPSQESLGGIIIIYSNENDVILFLDGHRIDVTRGDSTVLRGIPPGKHELVAVKPGFREITMELQVQKDVVSTVQLTMEPSRKPTVVGR